MTLRPIIRALVVPVLGLTLTAAPQTRADEAAAKKVVNVNQASAAELERLPRVGPKLAERIVAHRSQHGAFKRVEDLMEVKGVGEKTFALLKPYLSTAGATTLTEKVSSASRRGRGNGRAKAAKGAADSREEKG